MVFVRMLTLALAATLCGGSASAPVFAQAAWGEEASGAGTSGAQSSAAGPAEAGLVDVNHASQAELKTLPGVGEAYSLAIIKHRPYKNKAQLRSRGVIPLAAYNRIRDKIIAKQ